MKKFIRILTLNIGNPSVTRAKRQLEWLNSRNEDIIILTETKNSEGCHLIEQRMSNGLRDLLSYQDNKEYDVCFPKSKTGDLGVMCISRIPFKRTEYPYEMNDTYYSRLLETSLDYYGRTLLVSSVYVPSRDNTPQKIDRKKNFLEGTLSYLSKIKNPSSIVCGDFNIVDRNHHPHYNTFYEWEYEFYDSVLKLGYIDTYRYCHPNVDDYSWVGRTGDGYRYDYCFVSEYLASRIKQCDFVHETRTLGLTDHSGVYIELYAE